MANKKTSKPEQRTTTVAKKTKTSAKRTAAGAKRAAGTRRPVAASAVRVAEPERADELVGKKAPAFALADRAGKIQRSAALAGKPSVLYFYPKDDTPGCTREACDFRDGLADFSRAGIRVLGVSPDSPASHDRFAAKYGLSFTLLSDPDKTLAQAYGVWVKKKNYGREYMGIERSTFLVDGRGVVRRVWRGVKVAGHVQAVLDAAREL
jgi:peroxiredoxin Q/BCP